MAESLNVRIIVAGITIMSAHMHRFKFSCACVRELSWVGLLFFSFFI